MNTFCNNCGGGEKPGNKERKNGGGTKNAKGGTIQGPIKKTPLQPVFQTGGLCGPQTKGGGGTYKGANPEKKVNRAFVNPAYQDGGVGGARPRDQKKKATKTTIEKKDHQLEGGRRRPSGERDYN